MQAPVEMNHKISPQTIILLIESQIKNEWVERINFKQYEISVYFSINKWKGIKTNKVTLKVRTKLNSLLLVVNFIIKEDLDYGVVHH